MFVWAQVSCRRFIVGTFCVMSRRPAASECNAAKKAKLEERFRHDALQENDFEHVPDSVPASSDDVPDDSMPASSD